METFFEGAQTDVEVEAYFYLKMLPEEVRSHVTFANFLIIKDLVTAWTKLGNKNGL